MTLACLRDVNHMMTKCKLFFTLVAGLALLAFASDSDNELESDVDTDCIQV